MAIKKLFRPDTAVEDVTGAALTTDALGLPVPLAFVDPGSDAYTAALTPGRICGMLRVIVGNSGVVISLDGGTTASIGLPPNCMDDISVPLAADTSIKVKRYTAGVAMTNLVVEVR